MGENKNSLQFSLTSKQMKFKDILEKEFLEMEVYAISDINPNRNNSHFTLEAMEKSIKNFKNKPIVGFFENNDFESHAGKVSYDTELGKKYWNTEKGERILGWIRESDPVEIVEKDGLHWIKFRCALCTKYCYNQVKRLLKDRRKKVSVEITVNESFDNEGIEEITDFTLNGVTILGSKRGKPVIEGIPDAHLSILENIDSEEFDEQREVLTFEYRQFDSGLCSNQDINSDENSEKNFEDKEAFEALENNEEKCEVTFEEEEKKDGCGENEAVTEEVENGDSCSQESEACGDGEPQMSENGEECEKCEDGCEEPEKEPEEDYKKKCEEYALIIESLKNEITEKENHYSSELEKYKDYEDIKKELFAEKEKVKHYFCEDLKRYAIKIMSGENLPKESYDSIIENCYSKYSCEEDIKKDVAYAVYNARPTSEKRFSVSIETEAAESKEEKTMSVQERLAARAKKYEK